MRRWSYSLILPLLAVSSLAITTPAGADAPTEGSEIPDAAQCYVGGPSGGTCEPGPFDSGQEIIVSVPANSVFTPTHDIQIQECAAPDGAVPTGPGACDPKTTQANGTIFPDQDGSIYFNAYIVYALPDSQYLLEGPTSSPVCGDTAASECVLYIGVDPTDFTQPHVFSQPFLVKADPGDGGHDPGDGTPEVPVAVMLPVAAMGVIGGAVLFRRRRSRTT